MKWFKHDTAARNDTRIKLLKKKFGAEGYGIYFQMLEIVGENIKEKNQDEWGFVESIHTIETLADESGVSPYKLRQVLLYMNQIDLLYEIGHRLCAPKILTRLDEYANKRKKNLDVFERKNELERQYREDVGTQSGENRALEQNKNREKEEEEEENSIVKVTPTQNKYPNIEDVTDQDLEEIAQHYKVPIAFVRSKCEDMMLWVGQQPNNSKLRDRNWRLTLMNWTKKDAIKYLEKAQGDPSKRGIDARGVK